MGIFWGCVIIQLLCRINTNNDRSASIEWDAEKKLSSSSSSLRDRKRQTPQPLASLAEELPGVIHWTISLVLQNKSHAHSHVFVRKPCLLCRLKHVKPHAPIGRVMIGFPVEFYVIITEVK